MFIVVVWLGLPCFLIGGTLPVMVKFAVRRLSTLGQQVGALYFVNTLGAAVGTLLTGFVLIEWLGLKGASMWGAALNVSVGLAALWLSRGVAVDEAESPTSTPSSEPAPEPAPRRPLSILVPALAFFISGASSLLLEMSWTRLIMSFLQTGAIVISVNLCIMLLGFALGGVAVSKAADDSKSPQALAAMLFAATALATLVGLSSVEPLSMSLAGDTNPYYLNWLQLVSVVGMFPASLCMGAVFPVLVRVLVVSAKELGTQLGGFYALNTVGTVIGGVAAPFFMIPRFGTSTSILTAVVLQLLMALALWLQSFRKASGKVRWATAALGVVAIALIPASLDVYHQAVHESAETLLSSLGPGAVLRGGR